MTDKHTTPRSEEQLLDVIRDALTFELPAGVDPDSPPYEVSADHYSASAEALVDCALAAFNYAADQVGATGFQASWALLQILWKGNGWKGPGTIVRAEDNLYPQYPTPQATASAWAESDDVRRWLRDRARELLAVPNRGAVPAVVDHWKALASIDVPDPEEASL